MSPGPFSAMPDVILEPLRVFFGRKQIKVSELEILSQGITFKVIAPQRCYPTIKYKEENILQVEWTTITSDGYQSIKGHYLFLTLRPGSLDDFEDGLNYDPLSEKVQNRFVTVKLTLDSDITEVLARLIKKAGAVTNITPEDAIARYMVIHPVTSPVRTLPPLIKKSDSNDNIGE